MTERGLAGTPRHERRTFTILAATLAVSFWLCAARTMPIVWLLPIFGGARVPAAIRLALGGMVAALCLPTVSGLMSTSIPWLSTLPGTDGSPAFGALAIFMISAREVLVGCSIGIAASVTFRAAELAGSFAGMASAPAATESSESAGAVRELYLLLSILGFLELGGLQLLFGALFRSYAGIPVGGRLERGAGAAARLPPAQSGRAGRVGDRQDLGGRPRVVGAHRDRFVAGGARCGGARAARSAAGARSGLGSGSRVGSSSRSCCSGSASSRMTSSVPGSCRAGGS